MLFDRIESPVPDWTLTPAATLKAIVLPWPLAVPPIVLFEALVLMMMPSISLPSGNVPVASVPISFPSMHVAGRRGTIQPDAPLVGRDHVAGRGGRPPHRVAGRPLDQHALVRVAPVGRSRLVDADKVPLDQVPRRRWLR